MNEKHDIGLVAPLPPQTGGVASFAQWLLDSAGEIGVEYRTFDLRRPLDGGVGGRLRGAALGLQLAQLLRFISWCRTAPRVVHYCVSLSGTGLPRDLVFVGLLRAFGRKTVAHVHGPAAGPNEVGLRNRALLGVLARLSVRRVAVVVLDGWTFVPNPLRFVPESPPKRVGSENVSVLAVGAYGRAKGSDVLIKALADARRQGVPLTLAFVGHELHEGEESYLRRERAELGLEGLVTFAGVLDREEVAAAYSRADIFCLPSLREGLPMSLLEAMAFALPVVMTPVGAIPAIVENERSGVLVAPSRPDGVAAALVRLAQDPELRRRLGEAASRRVRALCDQHELAARWRSIYSELA